MALDMQEPESEGTTCLHYAKEIAKQLPLPVEQIYRTIDRLHRDGYLHIRQAIKPYRYLNEIRLTGHGLRAIGAWPSENNYDALLEVLNSRIEAERDPETKSRLSRLLGVLQVVGRDVGTSLLTEYLKRMTGLA
jgi:DNA-binding PadR family transcriptional regulator